MLESIMSSVYGTTESLAASVTTGEFLICTAASLILGLICALVYMFKHKYSKNFVITLAMLPLIVQMVITLVNGNLGAGIAVMGVFNLVRFRSIPGTAKDISSVFLAMAIGLATGMGFLGLAALFTLIVAAVNIIYVLSPFGSTQGERKTLKITVPEDLEFDGMFDGILNEYATKVDLTEIKTTSMGSLYELTYDLTLADKMNAKRLIDEIRCLNGNLKVSLQSAVTEKNTL